MRKPKNNEISMLRTVRKHLEENPEIIVEHIEDKANRDLDNIVNNTFAHEIEFYVAPKTGLYTPKALNGFMKRLMHNLREHINFRFFTIYDRDESLELGALAFGEEVGKIDEVITISDPDLITMIESSKLVDGKATSEGKSLFRRIDVLLYPNQFYIQDLLACKLPIIKGNYDNITWSSKYSIPLAILDQYKKGVRGKKFDKFLEISIFSAKFQKPLSFSEY